MLINIGLGQLDWDMGPWAQAHMGLFPAKVSILIDIYIYIHIHIYIYIFWIPYIL